jgi:hypothetical protein
MRILNRRNTSRDWTELACAVSCYALVLGYMAAFCWDIPALYVVSLIPGAVSVVAAHFHDWSSPL